MLFVKSYDPQKKQVFCESVNYLIIKNKGILNKGVLDR